MKVFLRTFVFTYLALITSQTVVKTFIIFDSKTFWMVVLGLTLLNIFKRPVLELISLPSKGPLFFLISIFLTVLLLNIFVAIIPNFRFIATQTPSFNILSVVIPSTYLSAFTASIFTAVLISTVSSFLHWLTAKK